MQDDRYTIQRGDTLWDLARRWGTTVDELMRLNPQIQDRNLIYAGAKMRSPVPQARPAQQSGDGGSSSRQGTVGDSSPISPLKELGIAGPGPLFDVQALSSSPPNLVQMDADQASQGMETQPEIAALQAAGLVPMLMRGIPALARAMPATLPQAGVLGNFVKGAVHWPGATPSITNVAPLFPNNPGAAKAFVQGMLAQRASQGGQELLNGARIPGFGPGVGLPPNAPTWSNILEGGKAGLY